MPLASLGPACAWRSGPSLSSPVLSSRTAGQGRDPEAKPPRPCPPPPSLPPRPLMSLPRSGIPLGTVFLPSWPLCLEVRWSRLGLEAPSLQGHLGRFHNVPSSCFVFARPVKEHWARRHFAGEKPGLIGVARPAGGREASEPASGLAPRGWRRWARVSRKSKPFWAPWHLAPS